jgi:lipopolysaccharide transport system ATP-binding protein
VGDAEFQKKCLGKMESVAKEGRTVLFVSHNMIAIENLCNKGIVLNNGRMKFNGNINEAVESYMTGGKTEYSGEESWQDKENAPGNHQVKLKAIRIVSDGKITGTPGYDHDIEIQIDYWNLTADERRLVSLHVHDVMGILLFTSGNMTSVSSTHDEWCYKKYPEGLFRTNCIIPKELLNTGIHSLSLYINGLGSNDNILLQKHVISFEVKEIQSLRKEYYGKWLGAVRPKLSWKTEKLE